MKIEKGKLYYDASEEKLFKCGESQDEYLPATDKIAVHCATKEDWDYVINTYNYNYIKNYTEDKDIHRIVYLDEEEFDFLGANIRGYKIISIEEFKKFYPPNLVKLSYKDLQDVCNTEGLTLTQQLDQALQDLEKLKLTIIKIKEML